MYEIKIDRKQLRKLYAEAKHIRSAMPRHLKTAINKVAATVRVEVAQRLGKVMNIKNNYPPKKISKTKTLKKAIKMKSKASNNSLAAILGFHGGYDFPLKYFDAKPYKRRGNTGVQVTYSRPRGGKTHTQYFQASNKPDVVTYFMLPSRNHHVYSRIGKEARPIRRLYGPKPGDYFSQINAVQVGRKVAEERLPIEIERRMRAIMLEKKGIINLKASRGT